MTTVSSKNQHRHNSNIFTITIYLKPQCLYNNKKGIGTICSKNRPSMEFVLLLLSVTECLLVVNTFNCMQHWQQITIPSIFNSIGPLQQYLQFCNTYKADCRDGNKGSTVPRNFLRKPVHITNSLQKWLNWLRLHFVFICCKHSVMSSESRSASLV